MPRPPKPPDRITGRMTRKTAAAIRDERLAYVRACRDAGFTDGEIAGRLCIARGSLAQFMIACGEPRQVYNWDREQALSASRDMRFALISRDTPTVVHLYATIEEARRIRRGQSDKWAIFREIEPRIKDD